MARLKPIPRIAIREVIEAHAKQVERLAAIGGVGGFDVEFIGAADLHQDLTSDSGVEVGGTLPDLPPIEGAVQWHQVAHRLTGARWLVRTRFWGGTGPPEQSDEAP